MSVPDIYRNIYLKMQDDALKTDFLRFAILNEKGGFVIDSKLEPLYNINMFPMDKNLILAKTMEEIENNTYCNKFLACTPHHHLLES